MASQIAVKAIRCGLSQFRITIAFALAAVVLAILGRTAPAEARPVQASIVVDVASGKVLQSSNADSSTYPASLTKMMTLYLLFEALETGRVKLTDTVTFSKSAAGEPATNLNVQGGDRITVETAILALVVRSANDAATAIAEHLGGTESGFARLMTNKAKMLGMSRTTFRNANGLPDANQRTTARDMATLSIALYRDFPQYYGYFKRTSFKYRGVNYAGHNKLLKSFKGYDGIKTGYIRASGFNLASSAERDGRRLVVVVLGGASPSARDRQVAGLLNDGFKTTRSTGTLVAVDTPVGSKVKVVTPPPALAQTNLAGTNTESTVEDVIANVLIRPAQVDSAQINSAEADAADADAPEADVEAATGIQLAGIKSMMPMLKPGTRSNVVSVAAGEEPDSQATTVVWKPAGDYGIQVGAYSKYNAAQQAAQTATRSEHRLLSDARIIIDTQKMNNGSKLYRARVAGLSKSDALTACRNLQAKRTDCLVLKIDPALAMGN
jgi:D-alanyl-D-alanine carboxypeptidase